MLTQVSHKVSTFEVTKDNKETRQIVKFAVANLDLEDKQFIFAKGDVDKWMKKKGNLKKHPWWKDVNSIFFVNHLFAWTAKIACIHSLGVFCNDVWGVEYPPSEFFLNSKTCYHF